MVPIARRDLLLFLLVFTSLVVRLLLSPPIWHHAEAREGLVVQEIVRTQQWILPFRNGDLPSKPPLFHWLAALPSLLVGANDFTVRLPSAIGALVMTIAVFLMGGAMGVRRTAWLAVGALLGMNGFWDLGTQARVDMVFSACIAAALGGFFFWYRDGRNAARTVCYIASVCAVLAKGPAGMVLPGLAIAGFLAVEGRLRYLWKFWSWPLAGVVLLLDVGWYAFAYRIGGNDFLGLQILRENVDRFLGRGAFSGQNTSLNTVLWLADLMLPWSVVLLWSLIRRIRGAREDWAGRFLHAWWISIFGFFVLAARARPDYLLPVYPAIALLAGRALGDMMPRLAEPAGFDSVPKTPDSSEHPPRPRQIAKRVGIAIALFDLTLMLVNPKFFRDSKLRNARLAIIKEIDAIVPKNRSLFATPEFDNSDTVVIAYRLGREIDRKPITCAGRNDYFLLPLDVRDVADVKTRILAASKIAKIALVAVNSETLVSQNLDCVRRPARLF